MDKQEFFTELFQEAEEVLAADEPREECLANLCRLLRERVPYYDWVGFYLVEPEKRLVLGPYDGEPTGHVRIEFGRGVCGQAAEAGETIVVQDVSTRSNYLSCSAAVKAEIVVPIFKQAAMVAELDIDSHSAEPFTGPDREFLERLCERLSGLF